MNVVLESADPWRLTIPFSSALLVKWCWRWDPSCFFLSLLFVRRLRSFLCQINIIFILIFILICILVNLSKYRQLDEGETAERDSEEHRP